MNDPSKWLVPRSPAQPAPPSNPTAEPRAAGEVERGPALAGPRETEPAARAREGAQRKRYSRAQRARLLADFESSGVTPDAFCAEHGILRVSPQSGPPVPGLFG